MANEIGSKDEEDWAENEFASKGKEKGVMHMKKFFMEDHTSD